MQANPLNVLFKIKQNKRVITLALKFITAVTVSWLLTSCVTEQQQLFSRKVDFDKALTNRVELGLGYLQKGDIASAKRNMKRALELDPKSSEAHAGIAMVFQKDGEPDLAEEHYEKALSLAPKKTSIRDSYGEFLFQQNRFAEALTEYEKVVEDSLYEQRSRSFARIGMCYMALDKPQKAEESFLQSTKMSGDKKSAARELTKIYFNKEQYEKAKKYYDFYTKDEIKTAEDLWMGLRLERMFGNTDAAESYALALKNLYPYSQEYLDYKKMYNN